MFTVGCNIEMVEDVTNGFESAESATAWAESHADDGYVVYTTETLGTTRVVARKLATEC